MPTLEQPVTSQSLGVGMSELGVLSTLISQLSKQRTTPQGAAPQKEALVGATKQRDIALRFNQLAQEWKANRSRHTSFARDQVSHPAYLEIIGLGPDALPLILKELETELDHWFVALKSISHEDPVPAEKKGKMEEMRNAWIKWGHDKGYTW